MQIVIESGDFRRLSQNAQKEILELMSGRMLSFGETGATAAALRRGQQPNTIRWRQPVSITHEQALKLVHGLPDVHRKRLSLFARKSGRVGMRELLALTGDKDLRTMSDFQQTVTRRLRRLIDDPERKAQLIGWDFDATKWDESQTTIVDGVYYVSLETAEALSSVLTESKSVAANGKTSAPAKRARRDESRSAPAR